VDGAAVAEVADQREVDALVAPAELLEEAELVEEFLGRVLVLAVAGVDERRPRVAGALGPEPEIVGQPAADALELGTYDEARLGRVADEHLDRVRQALVLGEARGGRVEHGGPDAVEQRRVAEALPGPGRVLEEHEVGRVIRVGYPEGRRVAPRS